MANIDPLVQVSKVLLAENTPDDTVIHYCIYHSQFPLLQRSKIEKQLDKALSRSDEQEWLSQSGILEVVKSHDEQNHVFVVLATAVAEVGRDHDYDWAIVEPSSMRSIIQLAGRVQRHRKQEPSCENIHILSKNFKGLKGKKPSFEKPGFESKHMAYADNDLTDLVGKNELDEINAIARIRSIDTYPELESPTKTGDPPKFKLFNELEHFAQTVRLVGSAKVQNHASLWWNNEATWCGELQSLQPFRLSQENDEFCRTFTRTGKPIWQKKVSKNSPVIYENTSDIADKPECIKVAKRNIFWGEFNLKNEITKLVEQLEQGEEITLKKFTHLSLTKLKADSDEQWQCHPQLGLYKNLKKDEYQND
jgi:CRISPR-associated endonuclease/helicase Cas3